MIVAELLTLARLVTNRDATVVLVNNTDKTHNITVPLSKRWFLFGGLMSNADNVARNTSIYLTDGTNIIWYLKEGAALAAAATCAYPDTQAITTRVQMRGPLPMDAGWQIRFIWAAGGASAGGNATVTAIVLEIDV